MRVISKRSNILVLLTMLAVPAVGGLSAQEQEQEQQQQQQQPPAEAPDPNITVTGTPLPDPSTMAKGPEVKGIISGRSGDRMRVTTEDGNSSIITIMDSTKVKNAALFGGKQLGASALLNGLPVTVKTLQSGETLVASQVTVRSRDLRTAKMIRNGTVQQFEEQAAATQALRSRMGDIDKYNIKNTTNVYFDTGKSALSQQAKTELCAAASQAESTENALMLVVGYTDSVGSQDYNQVLSERRASSVINYLQQACRWKPYRMLTPTGMAEADPAADNNTAEGKAQNRRVSVNILVSKSVDGI